MSGLPKLVVILGPTASGKTEMALKLAKKFNGEIVNADSRQIYRGMDVGTAKLMLNQKLKVKSQNYKLKIENKILKQAYYGEIRNIHHWLIDVVNPDEEFTVADYKKMAVAVIYDILKRGKQPFLVGGTGLYIQAVIDNLTIPNVPPNKKLRAEFERDFKKARESGIKNQESRVLEKWYKKLLKLDPEAIHVVDPKNPRRIIRAIEVCLATHEPFSKLRQKGKPLFDVLQIGIDLPREKLYKRIDRRVERMIKHGLIEETKKLLKKYDPSLPSMSGIGYKEIGEFINQKPKTKNQKYKLLNGKIQEIKWRTHAYARRQMTWFRHDKRIKWIKNYREAEREIKKFLCTK